MAVVWCVQLGGQAVDFGAQGFVFGLFALQKPAGERDFFQNALRGQHVDVAKFVLGMAEVLHLDPAFVDERIEAVIEPAGADAQLLRDFTLRQVRVVLQHAQHPKVGVFLQLRAAAGGAVRHVWAALDVGFKHSFSLQDGYRSTRSV